MEEIIKRIPMLNRDELQTVFLALRQHYMEIFPDWEILFLSVHKDPGIQKEELINVFKMLFRDEDIQKIL